MRFNLPNLMDLRFAAFLDVNALGKPLIGSCSSGTKLSVAAITAVSLEIGMCTVSRLKDAFIIIISMIAELIGISCGFVP